VHWTDYRFFPTSEPIKNQRSHVDEPKINVAIAKGFEAEVRKFFSRA
jgi:hypothetical protein